LGKKSKSITFILFFMIMIFVSACKTTTEVLVWDPTGVWSVTVTHYEAGGTQQATYTEPYTFTGTDSSGTVTGQTVGGELSPQSGTWAKTADFSITFNYDFWARGDHLVFNSTGTSSASNPNSMSGSGDWYVNDMLIANSTWTATKTTNLQ